MTKLSCALLQYKTPSTHTILQCPLHWCSHEIASTSAVQDTKLSDDSMGMSERQPMFLKDKADAMHKAANYRAAVNAYSKAIQIDASLTACYSNRAASYLKLKEFR